jgi:hypothetical protein
MFVGEPLVRRVLGRIRTGTLCGVRWASVAQGPTRDKAMTHVQSEWECVRGHRACHVLIDGGPRIRSVVIAGDLSGRGRLIA